MKAFIYKFVGGKPVIGTGRVTPDYKNLANMKRFYVQNLPAGTYQIFAYHSWDNRYKAADVREVVHINGYPPELTSHGQGPEW